MPRTTKKTTTPIEKQTIPTVPESEWPYQVPENWRWVYGKSFLKPMEVKRPSGEFFKYIDIDSIDNKQQIVSEPKIVSTKDAPSRASRALHTGDTVFSMVRPYLKNIAYIDESMADSIASTGFYVCSPVHSVNPRYSYYMMVSPYVIDGLNAFMKGDNSPSIRKDDLENYPFPLPPLAEQQRIVDRIERLFAKLDEAREKAQAVVDGFENRKAAILHKAFTGELTRKWREDRGIGMEGWEHHKFSELCDIVRGGSPRPAGDPTYYGGNIPFMKVADITNNNSPYVHHVEYTIKEAGLKKTRMVEANTLLLTNSGATLGVPAISTFRTTFNDGIAAFLNLDASCLMFYWYFWTSKTKDLRAINMGAAQPNLNTNIIGSIEIDVPTVNEQKEIITILNNLFSQERRARDLAESVIAQIDGMKKSILARAFRGELGTNDPSESACEG